MRDRGSLAERNLRGIRERCVIRTFLALRWRVWDLREKLDLLHRSLDVKAADPDAPVRSDFHLPGTYRGGMMARLQPLLAAQRSGGAFMPGAAGLGASA